MPLFLVRDKNGIAIVQAENDTEAKLNVIDTCFCDVESLQSDELPDFDSLPNGVLEISPFKNTLTPGNKGLGS